MASCGGSLINDRYILTAAHCMKSLNSVSQLKVTLGAQTAEDRQRITPLEVEKVITNPNWKSFDDIALIKLKNPLNNVNPVCLPTFTTYDNLFVTGWGMTGNTGSTHLQRATELMEVDTKEVDIMKCKSQHFPQINPAKEICAGGEKGGSCMGDSGGPLQTRKNGRVYQVGIVSFGATDCATVTKAPNVYERVTGQLDWIKKNTADANWCDGPEQAITGNGSQSTLIPTPAAVVAATPRPRPTFVSVPARKPQLPIFSTGPSLSLPGMTFLPIGSISNGGRWTVISRPGGISSEDPFKELERMMASMHDGMSAFPSGLSSSISSSSSGNIGGRTTVVSSVSSGMGGLDELERILNRRFIRGSF